ncbi:MAG: bile acid:sodium symporter family protein [Saprospiraceae bacterium]|nr:bile acid:sodium symporter family protein [Saprospiraceae bacterium]
MGPVAIIALALLATGTNSYDKVKSLSYTLWILTAVTAAMCYPQYFLKIGDYTLSSAIVPLLQIIMFGMGTTMSLQDFMGVVKMPKGVIIGVLCQFTIMPLVGTGLAYLFQFPPEIAAGIILVGTSPSGLASNVMTYIAKANVALSVTLTAVATLLAPLITPLLMQLLAGQYIPIDFWAMMFSIFKIVIIPIAAGLLFNGLLEKPSSWQQRNSKGLVVLIGLGLVVASYFMYSYFSQLLSFVLGSSETLSTVNNLIWIALLAAGAAIILQKTVPRPERINQWMPFVSMLAIAAIIVVVTAVGRNDLMKVGALLIVACFLHNILGYLLGYWSCRVLRMDEKSCRTIAIEVGLQNAGLASGIAKEIGMLATVGLAPAVFGPLMNITGSSLASWWRDR